MSEIKIEEQRFLSLISSEKLVPKIVNVFISHLISEWKRRLKGIKKRKDRDGRFFRSFTYEY